MDPQFELSWERSEDSLGLIHDHIYHCLWEMGLMELLGSNCICNEGTPFLDILRNMSV